MVVRLLSHVGFVMLLIAGNRLTAGRIADPRYVVMPAAGLYPMIAGALRMPVRRRTYS